MEAQGQENLLSQASMQQSNVRHICRTKNKNKKKKKNSAPIAICICLEYFFIPILFMLNMCIWF